MSSYSATKVAPDTVSATAMSTTPMINDCGVGVGSTITALISRDIKKQFMKPLLPFLSRNRSKHFRWNQQALPKVLVGQNLH